MSGWRLPAPQGAWIDRAQTLSFQFNGQWVDGFEGDTVASALLAHGIGHVGRSYKLHRPRGIFSAGVEEPTGLLDIGLGAARTPNTRATDIAAASGMQCFSGNCWPSLKWDLGAAISPLARFLPAGFYYKTFMWPNWHLFEPTIRRMTGSGLAPEGPDPERYDEVSLAADVLVVGGGGAGLQAAAAAAQAGARVLLLEGDPQTGGWLAPGDVRTQELLRRAITAGVQVCTRTTAVALYDHNLLTAVQLPAGAPGVRERLLKIRARHIVLATGAFERPLLFPDNDRPGVMLAGAVLRYATHYGVGCGQRVLLATACDSAYAVAAGLLGAGIRIAAIVDQREPKHIGAQPPQGVEVLPASAIVRVQGSQGVKSVQVARQAGGGLRNFDADVVASAGGFTPNVNLYSQAGGKLQWHPESAMFVPVRPLTAVSVVGACAGAFDWPGAMEHAERVGRCAAANSASAAPEAPVGGLGVVSADNRPSPAALASAGRTAGKMFVDLQNDVAVSDVELAARENYRSVEHLKRYTTTGMGSDQGKTSNVNALVMLGVATQRAPQEVGTTRFRPPFKPVTLGAMAGGRTGMRIRPLRPLPARDWHAARGALFEEFGGWERPAAYPGTGETLAAAAAREAAHVRAAVGVFDNSPLGKLELYGPDAAAFLDLMYVGTMSTLAVGSARYGVLLNENGVLLDDGIVTRLGPEHFWVNTTSGGVERVALAFEEWLQCEYVHHRVLVMPLTAQWGNITVAGPRAWKLLARIGLDPALSPTHMKHMTLRDTRWRASRAAQPIPLRVLRASFSGELGYEINLPALHSNALLDTLWMAGQDLGVRPYGVEALMTLRLEKGFIHVGADTDGTTLPADVGMARGIEKKPANFVGRRSLLRPNSIDAQRTQLVGLQPVDRRTLLPVGAQLAGDAARLVPPGTPEGHVTSSAFSPALGQPIALAMLQRGTQRIGERVVVWHMGKQIEAEVVKTPFFDAAGEKLNA
jgi:sarcosine oxidase, subunit alpha